MVYVDLTISQLLMIGGFVSFLVSYLLFDLNWHYNRNMKKECDKCQGKGYIKVKE